ncbi:hypothetical protein EDD22DRAFT_960343 [Suillus occidentalis]|nr:hypothetical protein EDD22DRAFT_960343 [Suillus occidentalis]
MHRAFDSDDIVYSILEHLRFPLTDLRNVAMTCTRLAGPALNVLWSEQSSLLPLIMCLPQGALGIADETITPSEWERIITNASRVRRFIEPANHGELHPEPIVSGLVLWRLFERFPPATLFPNLCSFDSQALREYSSDISLVGGFMSPALEVLLLDVSAQSPTHEVEEFFRTLPERARGLRELSISMGDGDMAFAVLPSFGNLPKLIALTIRKVNVSMTRQVITNIQQARYLNTIELTLHGTAYDHDGGVTALELGSLERLSLFGDILPQCTHFIRQITTRRLSHVTILYHQPASPIEIAVLMESLSTSCQTYGSLKEIEVKDDSDGRNTELVIPLSSEVFRPLLKFTGLLSVIFQGIGNYNLDNRFINDIPDAWPGIQELKFASFRLAGCAVTFDCDGVTRIKAEDGREMLWPAQTALRLLHVGHSQVSEVARMPYILAKVFPDLGMIYWCSHAGSYQIRNASGPLMEEVREQLHELQNPLSDMEWEEGDDDDSEDSEDMDD